MFCMKCGKQLPDGAQFCMYCGTKLGQVAPETETKPTTGNTKSVIGSNEANKEIDREALILYLNTVLTLEYAKIALQNKQTEEKELMDSYESFQTVIRVKDAYQQLPYWFSYDGKNTYIKCMTHSLWTQLDLDCNYYVFPGYDYDSKHKKGNRYLIRTIDVDDREKLADYQLGTYDIVVNDETLKTYFNKQTPFALYDTNQKLGFMYSGRGNARNMFPDALKEFKKVCEEGYKEIQKKHNYHQTCMLGLVLNLSEQDKKLEEAYNLNIIPKTYRDIYAVSYIYDFLTSSNESLSSILMHYNLETVKQKLDGILENQSQIIMQNAYQMAQNQKIIDQNNSMLKRLESIETNTEMAAKYGRIAAVNSDTIAWIQSLDYYFN